MIDTIIGILLIVNGVWVLNWRKRTNAAPKWGVAGIFLILIGTMLALWDYAVG